MSEILDWDKEVEEFVSYKNEIRRRVELDPSRYPRDIEEKKRPIAGHLEKFVRMYWDYIVQHDLEGTRYCINLDILQEDLGFELGLAVKRRITDRVHRSNRDFIKAEQEFTENYNADT